MPNYVGVPDTSNLIEVELPDQDINEWLDMLNWFDKQDIKFYTRSGKQNLYLFTNESDATLTKLHWG